MERLRTVSPFTRSAEKTRPIARRQQQRVVEAQDQTSAQLIEFLSAEPIRPSQTAPPGEATNGGFVRALDEMRQEEIVEKEMGEDKLIQVIHPDGRVDEIDANNEKDMRKIARLPSGRSDGGVTAAKIWIKNVFGA
ncbi:MAG TPA: hypothetical protein VF828_02685 [Patescibacteria group bacterium]